MKKIAIVKIRSYGFLHPGKEQWKTVLKKCWNIIPGSTLYGAIATALIKTECNKPEVTIENCQECLKESVDCGYHKLLNQINTDEENRIRMSPLIPSNEAIENAEDYNRIALELLKGHLKRPKLGTTPHAPLNRQSLRIHGDHLYGIVCHQPFQDYYGFIVHDDSFSKKLEKAINTLAVIPFGGRGKYCPIEAEISYLVSIDKFFEGFQATRKLQLLTAMITDDFEGELLRQSILVELKYKRYRVWRTGLYWESSNWNAYKIGSVETQQTIPVKGISEGTKIVLNDNNTMNDLINIFANGYGNPDWTYLGWGQVIYENN